MKEIINFWDWVVVRMEEVGIKTFNDLERRSGFSRGAIIKRKNDYKLPTTEMAEGLCQALRVEWCDLWSKAGMTEKYSQTEVQLTPEQLSGLDADIYYAVKDKDDVFKEAVLKTIKAWSNHEGSKK